MEHSRRMSVMPLAGGQGGRALAHVEFGSSVNPITTRRADYAHPITASPPKFENLAASLGCGFFQKSVIP